MKHHDRYINLDKVMKEIREQKDFLFTPDDVYDLLRHQRFLNGFKLVHCEDCKFYTANNWIEARANNEPCECINHVIDSPLPNDYCSLGVFRNEEDMISE